MRVAVIMNPASGASALANEHKTIQQSEETIIRVLQAHSITPQVWYTSPEETGSGLARKAVAEGMEVVIAAGGDGTMHAVARGLIGSESALGIIPLGTMNNIARSLEIPEDITRATETIVQGVTRKIDVGMINEHLFLEVAGAGLEAAIFPAAEEIKSSKPFSTLRGIFHGLATLLRFKPTIRYTLSFDERRRRIYRALQVSVCNTPYYGARLRFAPRAVMDDGFLNVLIYRNFNKFEYIRHAFSISQGKRELEPRVRQRKIKVLRIETSEPVDIHADGIVKGSTPAIIKVLPGVLCVRVPRQLASGPNLMRPEKKRTRRYRRVQSQTLHLSQEEEGPAYVK